MAKLKKLFSTKNRRTVWALLLLGLMGFLYYCLAMPGSSYRGNLPALDADTGQLAHDLEARVRFLSEKIGERHRHTYKAQRNGGPAELEQAADWIEQDFQAAGYAVERQEYTGNHGRDRFHNLQVERKGNSDIVVVGAHYDSIPPPREPTITPVAWPSCLSWPDV